MFRSLLLAVKAALGQFEALVSAQIPANLHIFRFVSSRQKCFEIVRRAKKENALVVFTLVRLHRWRTVGEGVHWANA